MQRKGIIVGFIFFWLFLTLFKFSGGLHYALLSSLGERLLPLWFVGAVISLASVIQLVLDVPAGILLDRFGYRRMLVLGTVIFIGAAAFLFFGEIALVLVASILVASIGWLFFGPGVNAYILSHARKKNASDFMVYRDIAGSVGIVLSCIILPLVINSSFSAIAVVTCIFMGIALIAIVLSPRDKRKIVFTDNLHEKTHHQRKQVLKNFFTIIQSLNPASMLLLLLSFVSASFYGTIWFVVPLIIAHAPEQGSILGVGLSMFDLAIVLTGSLLNTLARTIERKRMIFFGLFIFATGGMLLGISYGWPFLLIAFLTTVGDEMASLPLWVWLHRLDKNHNKDGLISGIIHLFEDLGWAVGPLTAGVLYTLVGPTVTILIGAVPILLLLFIFHFSVRKHLLKVPIFEVPHKPHKARHKS